VEASRILMEGAAIEDVDKAMLEFGMPMGPFNLLDEIGIDVAAKASHVLEAAFGARMSSGDGASGNPLDRLVESGRLGKKNGKGFYIYEGKDKHVDESVIGIALGATGRVAHASISPAAIQERCVFMMINEAARCLAEGVVRRAQDVDAGMIFGTGFPPFRGGLLRYADTLGIPVVVERMQNLAEKHGERFVAAPLLMEMKNRGRAFYA